MLNSKANIKKEIRQSTKFIRDKLKAIEKNMMNKYPNPDYANEKLEKIRKETKYIENLFDKLNDLSYDW